MSCCGLEGLFALFRAPHDHEEERANFERTVAFLASVPLFRKQLPRSELPKVAQCLTRRTWQPGTVLVRQGETGRAFFLVEAGEALVVTCPAPGEPERTRATLCEGDYFGGHTLMTERPNIATIMAGGPRCLVTLSMSRKAFEDSGIKRWLNFPKRPAIYGDIAQPEGGEAGAAGQPLAPPPDCAPKSASEVEFIRGAIQKNVNLRALLQAGAGAGKLAGVATFAERRIIPQGTVVARFNEVGHEFFVIREGSFNVDFGEVESSQSQQSAEAAVARSAMAERVMRKQHFLKALSQPKLSSCTGKAVSTLVRGTNAMKSFDAALVNGVSLGKKRTSEKSSFAIPSMRSPAYAKRQPKQPRQGLERCVSGGNSGLAEAEVKPPAELHALGVGETFGELSLLYNTRREATFTAREDAVVYVVHRRHFKECFSGRGQRFSEFCELLDEVHALTSLLSSERYELACNNTGLIDFRPGERAISQGKKRVARRWYVIFSGSCIITRTRESDGQPVVAKLVELRRPGHFGERSLLRGGGEVTSDVTIEAGPDGMCCLTFDGEMIRVLLEGIFKEGNGLTPSVHCSVEEWFSWKSRGGWDRQVSSASSRVGSQEGRGVELAGLRKICVLGRGGYGQVALVQDTKTKRRYALKVLSKGYIQKQGAERLVRWERELLSMVHSPFVIRLHATFTDPQHIYFLLEAALGGSLIGVVRSHPEVLQEDSPHGSAAAFYVACLTAALEHLHERRIVHRDLKPENALLDERGYAKLCDMGFARFVLGKTNTLAGTPEYMAPEMIDFPHTHDINVDWWALGIVTYELLAGQTPFEDEGISDPMGRLLALRRSQERGTPAFPFSFPHLARGFVTQLLGKLPHRLGAARGAAQIREHGMFTKLKFDFEAFHDHLLPSPLMKEWTDLNCFATDDLGMDFGELGLQDKDSLFVPANAEQCDWDMQM